MHWTKNMLRDKKSAKAQKKHAGDKKCLEEQKIMQGTKNQLRDKKSAKGQKIMQKIVLGTKNCAGDK